MRSVRSWGNMVARLKSRDIDGLPPGTGGSEEELARWYERTNAYIAFVFHKRSNYVSVDVENNASLDALKGFCGAHNDATFGHANANPRHKRP